MEAKELMIGDWVNWHTYYDRPHYCKVMQIAYDPRIEGSDNFDCEPIPLTPEILKKNGFEENRDNRYQLVRYRLITKTDTIIIEPMLIESRLGNKWFWFTNENREMSVVKPRLTYPFVYVHQLQQALRLCGLSEIADNIKL